MKKKISELEGQLESQKKQLDIFQKNETELKMLKQVLIQAPKAALIPISQRRKTWAGGSHPLEVTSNVTNGFQLKEPTIEENPTTTTTSTEAAVSKDQMAVLKLKFDDNGRHVEYQNGDWDSFLNDTIGRMAIDFEDIEDSDVPSTPVAKAHQPARKSLLKTPKSLKFMFRGTIFDSISK